MVVLLSFTVLARIRADDGWSERPEGRAGVSATVKEPADAANARDPCAHACPQTEASYIHPLSCQASTPDPCLMLLAEAPAQ